MLKMKPFVEKSAVTGLPVHSNFVLDRVYRNRGISSASNLQSELDCGLISLLHPSSLLGMEEAVSIIERHILQNSKILVVGDYDCDGATATAIAIEGLTLLGAKNVEYIVPNRAIHGYGLSVSIVELAGRLKPDLIITVDNGIASFDGALAVKALPHRCELVVTDHHLAAVGGLPDAAAIVNPNQPGCKFESKAIAGCGVMFYVIMALRVSMRDHKTFNRLGIAEPSVVGLLDLVALGTVADVVPLDRNNRILVSSGLKLINSGSARPVINSLLCLAKREIGKVVSSDMGFAVGPRLNAAGRLDDMSLGINSLIEKSPTIAAESATILDDLNKQRRDIEADISTDAFNKVAQEGESYFGVSVYDRTWHEGVVGIVASRIKEKLNRPVICFTATRDLLKKIDDFNQASDPGLKSQLKEEISKAEIKGSARSVPGVHLKHILDCIAKDNPNILSKFGGHAMAAGLSIKHCDYEKFRECFDKYVRKDLTKEMIDGRMEVDIKDIPSAHLTMENAELIKNSGPWGQGFLEPSFSARFYVLEKRVLQGKHIKLKLVPVDSGAPIDAISFNSAVNGEAPITNEIEACFTLGINEYRGNRTLQLMVNYFQDEEFIVGLSPQEKYDGEDMVIEGLQGKSVKAIRKQ